MENKKHNEYLSDWQILGYPGLEFDRIQENEKSDIEENEFYSFIARDYFNMEREKRE